ncbi:LOW QUALITY PROTEIN: hypothetical protein KUTeg_022081 [Tegillarca granosa]|uniref:Prolow-density lipoprotein receptor-related protein 1-like beta-propeller domain-containing protein n=1 Tax=Tegillarca granosa TaxID=220873 RepID=A0ABQ9E5K8_TEGGR|nr:LOW QUALITY PROTEIN: hypothetical protein KUTeg_022081 [Tegillarca granosa]
MEPFWRIFIVFVTLVLLINGQTDNTEKGLVTSLFPGYWDPAMLNSYKDICFDMAPTARIHRALLTGENGKAIQATALSYPNAFALDIQNQTLYFADSVRNTLEAISYSDTRCPAKGCNDICVDMPTEAKLFWIDSGDILSFNIIKADKAEIVYEGVRDANIVLPYQDYLMFTSGESDIHAIALTSSNSRNSINITEHNSITGACYNNGGCQHICAPSTSGPVLPYKNNFMLLVDYSHTDHYPDRLVFHEGTGDLFFTATKDYYANPYSDTTSYIGVLRLKPDPKNPKHLILINDLDDPRCLTLYPQKGYIFYGEGGYPSYIGRANMDGTDQKEIAPADIPLGITVDYVDNMVYYCDYTDDIIYKVDIDGKNTPERFYSRKGSKMSDLIMLGQHLYFTGWNLRSIQKVSKDSQKEVPWMPEIPYLGRIDNIVLIPGEKQPDSPYCYRGNDTKYNGRCSTFCLPVPGGKTCQCEDKVSLIDEFNCDNEKTCQLTVKNGAFTGICDGKLAIKPCPLSVENGKFSTKCTGKTFERCSFECNKGFQPAFDQENVCLSTGVWSIPTNKLCMDSAGAKVSARTGGDSSASVSTVGGVLGAILAILIIIIIIGAVCYFTRRREMRSAVYKNEPNVYFNNPPVDENSYSQFNQPTGGTGDRYHQFSNPMSETDNAYDMISEKKNNAPDENGPATYYLKEVGEKKLDTSFKP